MGQDPYERRSEVRSAYDRLADAYLDERTAKEPPESELVVDLLSNLDPGARVLDAGCGQGTPVLNRIPAEMAGVGVDFSSAQLSAARTKTDAHLVQADLTALPIADESVDAVTALHSLIHIPCEEHQEVYAEFSRVIRPPGYLYVTAAAQDGWVGSNEDWLGSGVRMEWSFPSAARTREWLEEAGFILTAEEFVKDTLGNDDGGGWRHVFAKLQRDDGRDVQSDRPRKNSPDCR